ncbi:MAG: phosphate ABC transporter permease subunit PstC [Mariprofundaceae bacterium]|nr:phosphate ABC transporter permease subunit PstC [Mariprofundaceae bacterium]
MLLKTGLSLSASLLLLAALSVPVFLWQASIPFWQAAGISSLWGSQWYPYEHLYGLLPAIIGSAWTILIALAIAIPCGVAAAITASEMLSAPLAAKARLGMEVLAGIPSIVYGLIGLWLLLPLLQASFDLLTGHSLLAAGLMLALMILPTIMLMSMDALLRVAPEQREAGLSLGLDWSTQLTRILLPAAWPGMRSGILLGLGRALGETMAVMLVVGSMDRVPQPIYNILQPAQTLTSRIGREVGEAAFGSIHFSSLMAAGLTLAAMGLAISLMANRRT